MTVSKQHEKKIDRAFEVVERLEKKEKEKSASIKSSEKATVKGPAVSRSGLQIQFSLDALVSDKDTRDAKEKDLRAGKSNLLNFKFTVPYIWNIPVIGKTALKVVKRFQAEEYPESIRDILGSLKRKK
jgi:hypothetical protein